MINLDLRTVPFSRYGSYLVFSLYENSRLAQDGLYLRHIRGGDLDIGLVFRVELIADDRPIPFDCSAGPALLELRSSRGAARVCFAEPDLIRFSVSGGIGVRLTYEPGAYDYVIPVAARSLEVNSFKRERRFRVTALQGEVKALTDWDGLHSKRIAVDATAESASCRLELALEEYATIPRKREQEPGAEHAYQACFDFEACLRRVDSHFDGWLSKALPADEAWSEARELAAYITWSCVVEPDGLLTRPAMYMSKNWMTNIWSWDHCFNAMALARHDPDLAWDQFMIFFDAQDSASGTLPDFLNDRYASWSCCKPPIHGWALDWMMANSDAVTEERMREIYGPLSRWTNWWFECRDYDGDGVPQYNHGNDCGWDNSTAFLAAIPVESPDLCTFLILQMEVLASIAEKLGMEREAHEWSRRAAELLDKMIAHFWSDEKGRFAAMQSGTHEPASGDSLLLFLPILLGSRLPDRVRSSLIAGLKEPNRFLTDNGLATESVSSPYYRADGYWRGPIWAPSTLLLIEGLKASGEAGFAHDLAGRFCRMAASSGMAENYDALTGEGLRDRAFTWTSSVFLICASEIGMKSEKERDHA